MARLVAKEDAAKLAADPKAEVRTFYVEKAKGNTVPKHFMAEDNPDKKEVTINGEKVMIGRNKERSEYVAFQTGTGDAQQSYYVRDHAFMDSGNEFVTYERPKPEPKPKKEKVAKAAKTEGAEASVDGANFKKGKGSAKKAETATTAPAADEAASA